MKEIWVTQREGQAIEHVLLPRTEYDAIRVIVETAWAYTEVRGLDAQCSAYLRLVEALGKEKLGNEQEYDDGPWATTESDSCVDVAGYWHFPSPDVSSKGKGIDYPLYWDDMERKADSFRNEPKEPIRIVPLGEGFVVQVEDALGYEDDGRAFTDAFDAAEWLLKWLGLHTELEDPREVAVAAWAYIENAAAAEYRKLIEAVNDWGELPSVSFRPRRATHYDEYEKALGVAEAAQAYFKSDPGFGPIDHDEYRLFNKLAEAVKKWQGTGDKESSKTDTDT